jgi:hypothetical protein
MTSIPNEWLCPITLSILRDPVIAADGHSYERSAIEEWFTRSNRSPKTNEILDNLHIISNHALRSTINDFFAKNPIALRSNTTVSEVFTDIPVNATISRFEDSSKNYTHISVTARGEPKRQPLVLLAIVDNSGSMGELAEPADAAESYGYTRQDLVGHGLTTLATILGPDDMMGIIKFSTSAEIVMRPCKMNESGKTKANAAIKTITPSSQTNIFDGCRLANELANQPELEGRHIVAILLTDGFPNISPPRGIIETLRSLPTKNPWTLSTFGFGYNLDSLLLSQLAEWGNGLFGFIPDCTMVGTVLINFLANILSTATRNATLTCGPITVNTGPIQYGQTRNFIFDGHETVRLNGEEIQTPEIDRDLDLYSLFHTHYCKAIEKCLEKSSSAPLVTFYESFRTLATSNKIKALMRDITSNVASEGQVTMAVQEAYYKKWGAHYLRSYLHAQNHQMCMNFKDPGLQIYGGDLFHKIQTEGDVAFTTLPPPIPSGAPAPEYGGLHAAPLTQTPLSMASWHNQSGGCFHGDCQILMADGSRKAIKDTKAGELVMTPMGPKTIVAVVVCGSHLSSQPMVQLGALSITPWHPILIEGMWTFPASIVPYASRPIRTVYNFVLDDAHIVDVEGYKCCTLGHGFKGPVIEHEFFGDKVINNLKRIRGWETGRPTFLNLIAVRDTITGMITEWIDEPF